MVKRKIFQNQNEKQAKIQNLTRRRQRRKKKKKIFEKNATKTKKNFKTINQKREKIERK